VNYLLTYAVGRPDYTWFSYSVEIECNIDNKQTIDEIGKYKVEKALSDQAISFITQVCLEKLREEK